MPSAQDVGLLALRVGVGGTLFAHGSQKLFGWFGGPGLEKLSVGFDQMGFRPGKVNAVAAGLGEAGGGALLVLGLGTPAAGAAIAGTMIVASSTHVANGFFAGNGGLEFPAVLGSTAAALALIGPGGLSLDRVLGHRLNRPWMQLAVLVAVPAALGVISARRRALASTPPPAPATTEATA